MRIKDPYIGIPAEDRVRVQGDIDKKDYEFLFRKVLAARGVQEPIIATFFKKLCEELRKPEHEIVPYYDTDNDTRVQAVLDRLNFNQPNITFAIDPGNGGSAISVTGGESEQAKLDATLEGLVRRPDNRTDRRPGPRDGTRRTPSVGKRKSDKANKPSDDEGHVGG